MTGGTMRGGADPVPMHSRIPIAALACLLILAAPADAIYLMTPLMASSDSQNPSVGDTITITIDPQPENETAKADWGGKTVIVHYSYDTAEGSDDPNATSSDETFHEILIDDALALDAGAHATFTWTVPAEVDDRNVAIQVESAAGELLAVTDIPVGDAPPRIMAMTGPGGEVVEETPMTNGDDGNAPAESGGDAKADVPAPGIVVVLATLALAAFALRYRR